MKHNLTCRILLFVLSFPLFLQAQNPLYIIDIPKGIETEGNHHLSSVATSIEYIPLEAREGTFIKSVRTWDADKDFILVFPHESERLMQFDMKGKYLGDFLTHGKGPKEFIFIYSIDINDQSEVLLSHEDVIEIYSKDRTLKHRFKMERCCGKAYWIDHDRITVIFSYPDNLLNDGYHVNIYHRDGQLLKQFIHREDQQIMAGPPSYFFNNVCATREGLLYYDIWCDTVYRIRNDLNIEPYIILKKDKKALEFQEMKYGDPQPYITQRGYYEIRYVNEDPNFIFLYGSANRAPLFIIYSKATGHLFNTQKKENIIDWGFTNDINLGPAFMPTRFPSADTWMMLLNPQNIIANASYYTRFPNKYYPDKVDLGLFEFLLDCGNPVIVKANYKSITH